MVNGVSGSNLATSLRELDHATPQTQHQTIATVNHAVQHSLVRATTDTVTFSKAALTKSKDAEKNREKTPGKSAEQPVSPKVRGK